MLSPIPIPKRSPWVLQLLVIRALLNREITLRFGQYRLGFFWMLFEPLVGVLVIGLIIGQFAGRTVPEIPYTFFLLNGFLILNVFTSPINAAIKAVSSNQDLLVYPSVKPLDPLLAIFLYDLLTTLFSFVLFCVIGMWVGISFSLSSLHIVFAAFVIAWLCGCGLGLIFGVAAAYYNEVEKIVPVVLRPLLFVSAVLFPTNILSSEVQRLYFYNPLVHTIELSRNALFPLYRVEGANLLYPAALAIILFAVGVIYFNRNRDYLSQL